MWAAASSGIVGPIPMRATSLCEVGSGTTGPIRQRAVKRLRGLLSVRWRSTRLRSMRGSGSLRFWPNVADGWSSIHEHDEARAEQLLLEALERDQNCSMAHFAMGVLRRVQNRLMEAQIEFDAAIALDRNNARAHLQLGNTLLFMGQPEAGTPHIEKAIRLNPYDPNSATFHLILGLCRLCIGQVDEAIDLLRKARAGNPRLPVVHLYLAGALG